MKKFKLGSEVVVSDPCYEIPTWCQATLRNVLPGDYVGDVEKTDGSDGWGVRIKSLIAIHEDFYGNRWNLKWDYNDSVIGVDSGQAGIFNKDFYRDDKHSESYNLPLCLGEDWSDKEGDDWYQRMCGLTIGDEQWGTTPDGVVSSSGYGDGSYSLLVYRDQERIVGFKIDYIDDEDGYYDDDEDGYYDDDN